MKETSEKHPDFDPETYTNPILEDAIESKQKLAYNSKLRRNSLRICKPYKKRQTERCKYVSYMIHPSAYR